MKELSIRHYGAAAGLTANSAPAVTTAVVAVLRESNIFNSMENVDLDAVIGYKKDGIKHNFLEDY